MNEIGSFISGATFFGFFVLGIWFLSFWRKTHDRFFAIFSSAFFLLAFERLLMLLTKPATDQHATIFLIRLAAYLCIIAAILEKNLKKTR
jgi:hypothetical protein